MNCFFEALIGERQQMNLPEEFNYFGKLIGSWTFDYMDHNTSRILQGEWHFAWVLEGMAVQGVIILPSREARGKTHHPDEEYATTLRIYIPNSNAWDIAYCYTGKIMRMQARKQEGMIVLTNIDDGRKKWVLPKLKINIFIGRMSP